MPLLTVKARTAIIAAAAALFAAYSSAESTAAWGSKFINLGKVVNSGGDDYCPSATDSGRIVVFNSKKSGEKSHNIYMCRNNSGLWSEPLPLKEINSESNDETPFISHDGSTLIFSSDRPGGYPPSVTSDGKVRITYDLYISRNIEGRWSEPELIGGDVNTSWNERSPSLSRDGRTLFFSRWPMNNFGSAKIYMATLDNGRFSNVKELPESINSGSYDMAFTPSREKDKYYFASIRKGGMGGWDIYSTVLRKGKFSEPVNAGPGINSPYDDIYYSRSASGSMICSNRPGGKGKFDLYATLKIEDTDRIVRKKYVSYNRETRLKITAADRVTGRLLTGKLFRVILHESGRGFSGHGRVTSRKSSDQGYFVIRPKKHVKWITLSAMDPAYGKCIIKLSVVPSNYQDIIIFLTPKKDFPEKAAQTRAKEKKEARPENKADVDSAPSFKSIYFKFNSAKIDTSSYPMLERIVDEMRSSPELGLIITGHSDYLGSKRINYIISRKRAMAVFSYLKSRGISSGRMTVRAAGEKFSDSGHRGKFRHRDRRVDFTVTEK